MSVKKNICLLAAIAMLSAVFPEGTASPSSEPATTAGSQIELSDASTVIEETGITPERESIPDFSLILPLEPSSLPVLADSNISADTLIQSEAPDSDNAAGQDVFLEGAIGAGWPGFFSGDFSVYRNIGAEPFKLEFFHESVMGIGSHTAPDGYESQETRLFGEKQFALGETILLDAAAGYETRTDGLQGKNTGFYDISRQNISGTVTFNWSIREMLSLTATADGVFSSQFMSSSLPSSNTQKFMGISSSADLKLDRPVWSGDLVLKYDVGTNQNRFEAGAAFSVDILDYATVALSVSSLFARQSADKVLVPFALTVKTGPEAAFSGSISGGLKSSAVNPVSFQNATPFLFSGTVPAETTEWFGSVVADVPFLGPVMLNMSSDFAMTAQDGKRVLVDYTNLDAATGLAGLVSRDVTVLDTSFGLTVPLKTVNATLGWNTSWLDNTSYDKTRGSTSALTAGVSYADETGTWSAGTDIFWALSSEPEIGLYGCYQITKSVRFELEAVDLVSLFSGKDRLICNTYAERGGYAALFVKVNF